MSRLMQKDSSKTITVKLTDAGVVETNEKAELAESCKGSPIIKLTSYDAKTNKYWTSFGVLVPNQNEEK